MTRMDLPDLTVGWLGTGHMGAAMAARLGAAGLDLTVWNRTRSKAEALIACGAKVADEPVELADRDVVFVMVSASADLEEVVGRLLADPDRAPRTIVDCSTVSTEASVWARAACAARGAAFLAAPVSGNGRVVRAGMVSLICSGPREAFDELLPVLELLGRHVTYVGDGEHARLVKICHNVFLGVVAQNLAEITVLAEKGGVPRAALLDVINNSVMGSVFSRYKTPAFVQLDFTPTFTPVLLRKDFDLGARAADELGVPMPVAAAAREAVQAAIAQGRTAEDFAVLLELQAAASGLQLVAEDTPVDDGLGGDA
ncbi:MAG TPA: NAD(P)-dependent oxidoreductase [Mycobacteriales bacterium]|nr:NAD(P)-dependent oxidoreductase [Mycobacteriales bacterium]